jgi:hypothetical protein
VKGVRVGLGVGVQGEAWVFVECIQTQAGTGPVK